MEGRRAIWFWMAVELDRQLAEWPTNPDCERQRHQWTVLLQPTSQHCAGGESDSSPLDASHRLFESVGFHPASLWIIRESRSQFDLRAEFFNILNHPNYAQPYHNIMPGLIDNGVPGSPQIDSNPAAYLDGVLQPMGLITQTPDVAQTNPGLGGGGPRVIQFGLK